MTPTVVSRGYRPDSACAFQTKLCATRGPEAPRCDRAIIRSPRSAADPVGPNLARRRRWPLWIPAPRLRGDKPREGDREGVKISAARSAAAVAQEFAGQRAGGLAVFKGDLTVDQDPVVALGL